jgi:hypothetical protein
MNIKQIIIIGIMYTSIQLNACENNFLKEIEDAIYEMYKKMDILTGDLKNKLNEINQIKNKKEVKVKTSQLTINGFFPLLLSIRIQQQLDNKDYYALIENLTLFKLAYTMSKQNIENMSIMTEKK